MATKNTAGKAAGQAAALPADTLNKKLGQAITTAELLGAIADLASDLDDLHGRLKHEVSPLLRAIENLVGCHRVLAGIEQAANRDREFSERIAEAVEGWRDPTCVDPLELIGDLARVAVNAFTDRQTEAEALVSCAHALANQTGGAAA
jgi:hypothetical protein